MLFGKERIKGLVQRDIASGRAHYWHPDPRERAAGWKSLALGQDLVTAVAAAKKRNAEVEAWRLGGGAPRAIAHYSPPRTFGALLDRYEREKLPGLAANSQRVDKTQLAYLREWAGKHPVDWITRARVRTLRDAVCPTADRIRPGDRNVPGHSQAFKLLSKGREVFSWAIDHPAGLARHNPFERFALPKPPPRSELWDHDAEAAFTAAADALGYFSIGFALRLAIRFGQREADILALTRASWREITLDQLDLNRDLHEALKSRTGPDAGKAMGLYCTQGKTRKRVGVPIAGPMRDEIEAAIAASAVRAREANAAGKPVPFGTARLIVRDFTAEKWRGRDLTGEPWSQRDFIEKVALIRARAATDARNAGDEDLAARLEALQFLDARRTCVTRLANLRMTIPTIAAITGHSIKTVEKIIETYLVRTETQAAHGTIAMLHAETRRAADKAEDG